MDCDGGLHDDGGGWFVCTVKRMEMVGHGSVDGVGNGTGRDGGLDNGGGDSIGHGGRDGGGGGLVEVENSHSGAGIGDSGGEVVVIGVVGRHSSVKIQNSYQNVSTRRSGCITSWEKLRTLIPTDDSANGPNLNERRDMQTEIYLKQPP